MEILTDSTQIKRHLATLTASLRRAGERVGLSGGRRQSFVWNPVLGFWCRQSETSTRFQLSLGLEDPRVFVRPRTVCRLDVGVSQSASGASGALVRYGADVVLAVGGALPGNQSEFLRFIDLHEYGLVQASLARQGGKKRDMLLITSVRDENAPLNLFKFVRCMHEFRAWRASGLIAALPGEVQQDCRGHHSPLVDAVSTALAEQLEKRLAASGAQARFNKNAACSFTLDQHDGKPLALFEVLPDISPQNLFLGAGRLVLSRQALLGTKCLVLPAKAGPFFTQAMHRQGIQVVTYTLTKAGVVFFDLDDALAAMS